MRFDVLGVGSIGTLLAFHLRKSSRDLVRDPKYIRYLPAPHAVQFLPPPHRQSVVLRLRRPSVASTARRQMERGVIVERDGVWQKQTGFGIMHENERLPRMPIIEQSEDPSERLSQIKEEYQEGTGSSYCREAGYGPEAIDSLIVTTKAQNTLSALRPISHQITPATTIVLLQNGQGVLDILLERLFTDPSKRPNFILASTTHGAWSKNRLHCVHAAFGRLDFGIVPSGSGETYEKPLDREQQRPLLDWSGKEGEGEPTTNDERWEEEGEEEEKDDDDELGDWKTFLPQRERTKAGRQRVQKSKAMMGSSPLLDLNAIPDTPKTRTLRGTVATLLNLPLDVHWNPIRSFQLLALRKLVINACINPLTALAQCKNGDLFGNKHAEATIRDITQEASALLEAQAYKAYLAAMQRKRQEDDDDKLEKQEGEEFGGEEPSMMDLLTTPSTLDGHSREDGVPAIDASLRPGALFAEVIRVARLTAPNWSSMCQDIRNGAPSTEIDFMNGYLSRLGRAHGIQTPVNDLLVQLMKLRTSRQASKEKNKL